MFTPSCFWKAFSVCKAHPKRSEQPTHSHQLMQVPFCTYCMPSALAV